MNFDLYKHTVYLCLAGSHAYGFSTPESDYDYRGIAIGPTDSYIGLKDKFEQCVDTDKGKHVYKHFPVGFLETDPRVDGNDHTDAPDMQIMELSKFVRLAMQNNPSVIEIIFTDRQQVLIQQPIMDVLVSNRHKLLSKACKARFCGYALSQLKRIQRHKRWLDSPPDHKPTRKEFKLPDHSLLSQDQMGAAEALIQREIDEFMVDQTHLPEDTKIELNAGLGRMMRAVWRTLRPMSDYPVGEGKPFVSTNDVLFWGAATDQGFSENFLEALNREKRYRQAKKDWDSYQHWLKTRNPKRAEIEKKFGFDLKHATHLVRLIRMAREILETGEVNVLRPDAEELLAIRNGAWSYEQIVEFAESEDEALNEVAKNSHLPKVPDVNFFHDMVFNMIMDFNKPKPSVPKYPRATVMSHGQRGGVTAGQVNVMDGYAMAAVDMSDLLNMTGAVAQPFAQPFGQTGGTAPEPFDPPRNVDYSVVITDIGPSLIQVIKTYRELTMCGLKEAKDAVERARHDSGLHIDTGNLNRAKSVLFSFEKVGAVGRIYRNVRYSNGDLADRQQYKEGMSW